MTGRSQASTPTGVAITGLFVLMCGVGVATPRGFSPIPASAAMEVLFFAVLCTALLARAPSRLPALALVAFAYVLIKATLAWWAGQTSLLDFVQGYKAFLYLCALALVLGRELLGPKTIPTLMKVLATACLIKYGYSRVLMLDPVQHARPGVLQENNYEILMLLLLWQLGKTRLGPRERAWDIAVVLVTVLSGSKSGMGALVAVLLLEVFRRRHSLARRVWAVAAGGVTLAVALAAVAQRIRVAGGLPNVDRFFFLQAFRHEVYDWPWWEFITGTFPMTPLSSATCHSLSYYDRLFSLTESHTCYSVVLHSYVLRLVFDHGLLGAAILYLMLWLLLRERGLPQHRIVSVAVILTVNALSISSFNSAFAAFPLLLILVTSGSLEERSSVTSPPIPLAEESPDVGASTLRRQAGVGTNAKVAGHW